MKYPSRFLAVLATFGICLGFALPVRAEKATVAVAAGMKFAMEEIAAAYRKEHPKDSLAVVFGATGKLLAQIRQGAPFDLFFAADTDAPAALLSSGHAQGKLVVYAVGRLVIWGRGKGFAKLAVGDLAQPRFAHIAIANPKIAPYGKRAMEALRSAGIATSVAPRLVYGESVTQAAQFVNSGNAQVGLLALSLALGPELASKGTYALVPEALHQPLEQGFVLTTRGKDNGVAKRFAAYLRTPGTRAILLRYGYRVP